MNNRLKLNLLIIFSIAWLSVQAQLVWPDGQLLPTFPASSPTADLIYLNGSTPIYAQTWTWQAEAESTNHNTGHLSGNSWQCQVGVDAANQCMIFGQNGIITSGSNIAEFKLLIDNNTANNDTVVDLDVRNITTGVILGTQKITRQQFTSVNTFVSFKINFQMLSDNQEIEMRVKWRGNANIKVDYVSVKQDNGSAELYLFSSLKGLVNKTQPRIFSYEGDAYAEGSYTWLQSLGIQYIENKSNNWAVLGKYLSEISGLIVYDPAQIHTVNLATTLARKKNALVTAPSFLSRLTAAPFNLPILEDLRGKFTSKLDVYQTLYDTYWPEIDHRLLIGLNPTGHKASLREYATALGAAVIWLDPKVTEESNLLNKFLSSMPAGANYMGWWPEEEPGVKRVSAYGLTTIASDFCTNLTYHSGMPRNIEAKPMPAKPKLENKIYVSFIISDGDNLQYVEHLMRKLWNNTDRGSVPIGWTLSPAMVDAMPGALNYYHKSSTENDNLISGPSGYGYTYPNFWTSTDALVNFAKKTEEYNVQAGLRVITIWNTITGGINQNVGAIFAENAPTLLGMTAQNTGGALSVYRASLPGRPLSCNYCTNEQAMKDHIATASANWDGNSPRFVIIQAQPWNGVTPSSFKNVKNSLNSNYVVVRPDHIFQLIREANNLTVNPGAVEGTGNGLTGTYYNGADFETEVGSRVDPTIDFNWGTNAPIVGSNPDVFSVRWTGQIKPRYSGTYTFYTKADNASRVWVDDKLIIDKWNGTSGVTYSGSITLQAGQKYNIKVEYFDADGQADCKLEWASPFQAREVVPQSQLFNEISGITNPEDDLVNVFSVNNSTGKQLKVQISETYINHTNVEIFDICGKSMSKKLLCNSGSMDINQLQSGTYIVSIKTSDNYYNKKIIIQ